MPSPMPHASERISWLVASLLSFPALPRGRLGPGAEVHAAGQGVGAPGLRREPLGGRPGGGGLQQGAPGARAAAGTGGDMLWSK